MRQGGEGKRLQLGAAPRRVLILDPDPLEARLLGCLLTEASYNVVLVDEVTQLIDQTARPDTHAVLLELDVKGVPGYQLCEQIRGCGYRGPLIFVSRQPDPQVRVTALRRGADDFVVKPYDPHELIARIEAVARRSFVSDRLAAGNVVRVGDAELAISEMRFTGDNRPPVYLTPTEMRLLECLMRNRSVTIRRETLIERAWPDDYLADTNRVDVYVARLRKKIETDPLRPEYIQTVRGFGYVFRPRTSEGSLEAPARTGMNAGPIEPMAARAP